MDEKPSFAYVQSHVLLRAAGGGNWPWAKKGLVVEDLCQTFPRASLQEIVRAVNVAIGRKHIVQRRGYLAVIPEGFSLDPPTVNRLAI